MAESFNLLRRAESLDVAPEQVGYSGVIIYAGQDDDGNDIVYRAGDSTGAVLEITNDWGSQKQADSIFQIVRGYKYQPYKAGGTRIDPSSEIGDSVSVSDVYGGIFSKGVSFGHSIVSNLEAPSKEEADHEFQVVSSETRRFERTTRELRASLSITASKIDAEVTERTEGDAEIRSQLSLQASQISAKVSSSGGSSKSFGWELTDSSWKLTANGGTVFEANKSGVTVTGTIKATSGTIGGFDIMSDYLSYNKQTWGGTNTRGAYIGTNGIQLGKNFSVDMNGNLTASGGTFRGTLYCDNLYVKNASGGYDQVNTAGMNANLGGGELYNASGWNNYSASRTWSGASYGLDFGDATNKNSNKYPKYFNADMLACKSLVATGEIVRGTRYLKSKVVTINGEILTIAIWQ